MQNSSQSNFWNRPPDAQLDQATGLLGGQSVTPWRQKLFTMEKQDTARVYVSSEGVRWEEIVWADLPAPLYRAYPDPS